MVCRLCGHTVEVTETIVERWADKIAPKRGLAVVTHAVELLGICAQWDDARKD